MTAAGGFAWSCCGRWAAERARFALYAADAAGEPTAWTFWDIQREANRYSNVFGALGVMGGERVALLLAPGAAAACALAACWQMGAVALPLPATADADTVARQLAAAGVRVAVVDAVALSGLAAARQQVPELRHVLGVGGAPAPWLRPWAAVRRHAGANFPAPDLADDTPALQCGDGEVLTHGALAALAARGAAAHDGYPQAGDLLWSPAGWATPAGLAAGLLAAWSCGQPFVAPAGRFDPAAAFALIDRYDVRNARLAPAQLEAMMAAAPKPKERYDCRLRTVATDGAVAPPLADWLASELGIAKTNAMTGGSTAR